MITLRKEKFLFDSSNPACHEGFTLIIRDFEADMPDGSKNSRTLAEVPGAFILKRRYA